MNFFIGLVCLLMAALLAWLSAPASMSLARTPAERVDVTIGSRLFGLLELPSERIAAVRSAKKLPGHEPGSRSQTPDALGFVTDGGLVMGGRDQQLFAPDFAAIDAFFKDGASSTLSLTSLRSGAEKRRFIFAQLATVVLAVLGLLAMALGGRR